MPLPARNHFSVPPQPAFFAIEFQSAPPRLRGRKVTVNENCRTKRPCGGETIAIRQYLRTIARMTAIATLPGYYTLYEAAEIVGVSHSQMSRYIRQNLLKAIELGHQKLIEQEAVHKFRRPPVGNPAFRKQRTSGSSTRN